MSDLTKIVVGLILLFILIAGSYVAGYVHVKNKWNLDIKVRTALLKSEKDSNKVTIENLNTQHLKDIENAKSQTGRIAINKWITDNGLLSDRIPVCKTTRNSKANSTSISDEASEEQAVRGRIEKFTTNCALDSITISDWQEWAVKEGLSIK